MSQFCEDAREEEKERYKILTRKSKRVKKKKDKKQNQNLLAPEDIINDGKFCNRKKHKAFYNITVELNAAQ